MLKTIYICDICEQEKDRTQINRFKHCGVNIFGKEE